MATENLRVEGLFRIGGNQKTINELKDKVDKSGGPIDLRNNKVHVRAGARGLPQRTSLLRLSSHDARTRLCVLRLAGHPKDVTSLLKLYLRELPDPLFTSDYYKHFVSVGRTTGGLAPRLLRLWACC